MNKIVIFGNSGSGKSTLAKKLALEGKLAHLDLDTIAWKPESPPQRKPIPKSRKSIDDFLNANQNWVVEGSYSDLLELVIPSAEEVIYLNLPISACVANAKKRPWEPHKYASKKAQDANLNMLIAWISRYESRADTFSKAAHDKLFKTFQGNKTMHLSNQHNR